MSNIVRQGHTSKFTGEERNACVLAQSREKLVKKNRISLASSWPLISSLGLVFL